MADFIANSACNGCKPKHLEGINHYPRMDLIAKMMRDRHVVRFLIAPTLFGKTAVSLEYAESIFDFENVFWLNAQSPCFLRDIDKGTFSEVLLSKTKTSSLVVFEDVPRLSAERLDAVSLCIDELLEHGWEVIVSMTPGCDALSDRQPDGIKLITQDFLASDDEVNQVIEERQENRRNVLSYTSIDRIPCLLWGGSKGAAGLLAKLRRDDLPTDALLGIFIMLVLCEGSLGEVEAFAGELKSDTKRLLERDYIFTGIDPHKNRFEALQCSIDEIASPFTFLLSKIAACSLFGDAESLVSRLADRLVGQGKLERACGLVAVFLSAERRILWLEASGDTLFQAGCLAMPESIFASQSIRASAQTAAIVAAQAWRLLALDDRDGGLLLAESVMALSSVEDDALASAALLVARFGESSRSLAAVGQLRALVCARLRNPAIRCDASVVNSLLESGPWWLVLAAAQCGLCSHECARYSVLEACVAARKPDGITSLIMAWALEDAGNNILSAQGKEAQQQTDQQLSFVAQYLNRCEACGRFTMTEARLLSVWDTVRCLSEEGYTAIPLKVMRAEMHTFEASILAQRSTFARLERRVKNKSSQGVKGYDERRRPSDLKVKQLVPTLHVRLFGGLEVSLDGREIDPRAFRRQSVKTLLALLVLNQGKELLRERLSLLLWPDRSDETSQRNFYSTWSLLRKALKTPEGECPYLVRLQYSCKLDARAVTSDVAQFDALCRKLLFENHGVEVWSELFDQINDLYRGDLLPSENQNEYILRMREEYRGRLVDAFVAAAGSLLEEHELQASLWFARAAVRRDDTREDAYTVLMRAQMAVGQRTAALDTYFKCKRYLSDELGIDPSQQAIGLYNTIITDEPGLETFLPLR